MSIGEPDAPRSRSGYGKALGARLRAVRAQHRLSLHAVETKSGGKWKAVVVGSYERGDRAISVARLAELADFYGVAVADLLPAEFRGRAPVSPARARVILDLNRVRQLTASEVGPLARLIGTVQRERGIYGGDSVTLRREDLRTLAVMYDVPVTELITRLTAWRVLLPPR